MTKIIIAKDKEHLQLLIKEEIQLHGNECDLNHIDTSFVKSMEKLFEYSQFYGDMSIMFFK